jgi:hypothetical protein
MNKMLQRMLFIVGLTAFFLGLFSGVGWKFLGRLEGSGFSRVEYPLNPSHINIAVDSQGQIFVGDSVYGRVQRFSSAGQFECGWFVDAKGEDFTLKVDTNSQVEVILTPSRDILTYTSDGQFTGREPYIYNRNWLATRDGKKSPYAIEGYSSPRIVDTRTGRTIIDYSRFLSKDGKRDPYAIEGHFFPRIVDTYNGKIIIATAWTKQLLSKSFLGIYFGIFGLAVGGEWLRRRKLARKAEEKERWF